MKYFGTDGIRQAAVKFTPDFINSIIAGLADYAGTEIKVLIGGDTRESSEWILQDIANALESLGSDYASVGVLSTPAINYCFYEMGFDFAIDVTASHNPYTDNGIKIFERGVDSGIKLSTPGCETIERAISEHKTIDLISTTDREDLHDEAVALYIKHLVDYVGEEDLHGAYVGVDCANGATSAVYSDAFQAFNIEIYPINDDVHYGQKINFECGSTHPRELINLVCDNHLDFGVAYDGDGDRCILVDETGAIVDGDEIIAIIANYLNLNQIAVTVMANQGLLNWAAENHIATEITAVGDSNVAEAMRFKNIKIGGEQSGHIILPDQPTGDGLLTSLMIAKIIKHTGKSLHTLASIITKLPQVMLNLPTTADGKEKLKTSKEAKDLLLEYSDKLTAVKGRLLVRPSGTENLIRITMWGDDEQEITSLAKELTTKLGEIL